MTSSIQLSTFICFRTAANAKKFCDGSNKHPGAGAEAVDRLDLDSIVSKLLVGVAPNLIWVTQRNKIDWKRLRKDQVMILHHNHVSMIHLNLSYFPGCQ